MSLFTSEPTAQSLPLYDTRKTFETSESEPLPTDASTEGSTSSEDDITKEHTRIKDVSSENKKDASEFSKEEKESSVQSVKSYEECKECNGKVVNDALSQENVQLIRGIKSKEKKLKETRRQLNEERTFYEQQKMDLWKTITKKKSKSQIVQTDESTLEMNTAVKDLETQIVGLKRELEKETNKSSKFKEKCETLRKKNGKLKSEISLNEEDYEKSWKEIQEKLEKYKKDCGNAEKNSGVIKNVYDQVLKKNAYLARSNFALQAELRRLYRKFEHLEKPSIKKISSMSTIQSASSPDLWRRHREDSVSTIKKKKMKRSKTAPSRSNANESSDNLVVSGSLISVHVDGEQKRLRPVFLVLDDKKKGSKLPVFGCFQGSNEPERTDLQSEEEITINQIEPKDNIGRSDSQNEFNYKRKNSPNKTEAISQVNKNIKQESTVISNDYSKEDRKVDNIKPIPQNELKDENESEINLTKTNNSKPKSKIQEQTNAGNEINKPDDSCQSNQKENQHELEESSLKINDECNNAECSTVQDDENETVSNKRNRGENICLNSENCVIECQTHSSSIQ